MRMVVARCSVVYQGRLDTTLPEAARTYALPARLRDRLHVYGFHGLSHAWASARAAPARRVVVAHLGSGSSLCAVLDGRSVDTTMGFTPTDGLVMGTRTGSLDPGAVAWLALVLRDGRLRALLPWRTPPAAAAVDAGTRAEA